MKTIAHYCEHKSACKWQCFHFHMGLAWGEVPPDYDPWRKAHERECGGKFIEVFNHDEAYREGRIAGLEESRCIVIGKQKPASDESKAGLTL